MLKWPTNQFPNHVEQSHHTEKFSKGKCKGKHRDRRLDRRKLSITVVATPVLLGTAADTDAIAVVITVIAACIDVSTFVQFDRVIMDRVVSVFAVPGVVRSELLVIETETAFLNLPLRGTPPR